MAKEKEKVETPAPQEPLTDEAPMVNTKRTEPAFLSQYRVCYPKCKKFYVTSDNLVFLESERKKAAAHQATLGRGELITY